jgi:hypothetical protein
MAYGEHMGYRFTEDGDKVYVNFFSDSVRLLRGTVGNYVLCWASFSISVFLCGGAVWLMTEVDSARNYTYVAFLFLIAQSFSMAKLMRDYLAAGVGGWSLEMSFVAPTMAYAGQTIFFYLVALLSAMHAVASVDMTAQWRGAVCMLLVWITSSSLHLAKTMRDKRDADLWLKLENDQQASRIEHIANLAKGTPAYQGLVWVSFLISVVMTLAWMWTWEEEVLTLSGKGFFSVCFLFSVVSCFHFAKLVRDREDPIESKKLAKNPAFQFLTVVSFVGSIAITGAGCVFLEAKTEQNMFLFTGFIYAVTSALALAKLVRDGIESATLLARYKKRSSSKLSGDVPTL